MSLLQNSFTSQQESPTRPKSHSLCQQLQQIGSKQIPDIINTSKNIIESDEDDNSFISPNEKNKLENQPEFQEGNKSIEEQILKYGKQNVEDEKKMEEEVSSGPKTVTLIQEEIVSRDGGSINVSSKLSQYSTEVDNQSFATFLSMRDTSYSSLIKNFQLLFTNISNIFTQRLQQISTTYSAFLKIKHTQQKSLVSHNLPLTQNKKNHIIYVDCKAVADNLALKINQQKQKRVQGVKQLQQIWIKLDRYVQSGLASLESKCKKIRDLYRMIEEVVGEMSDLMIPYNRKKIKKNINPQIYSNSFIRTKYLMNKQKTYLNLMSNYLQNVLSFIGYVCLDLQPKTCLIVKQCMLGYAQAMSYLSNKSYCMQKNYQILNKTNCYIETYDQVCKLLEICIPDFLKSNIPIGSQNSQKKLKRIIQSLISESQMVYIPVIELQNKDYIYHSKEKAKIKWLKVNHEQKYKSQSIEEHQIYAVLTHEGDLILELLDNQYRNQEKMAILKLKNLKFSKKNNQLYLTDKGTGVLGMLFSTETVLGSLLFQTIRGRNDPLNTPEGLTDQFIQKAKFIMEQRKQKKASMK